MKVNREEVKAWSEIIKTILGIVAVFVGAYWAFFLYTKKDAPLLEPRFKPSYQLSWKNSDDKCRASVRIILENTGAASHPIDRVHIQAWTFERVDEKIGNVDYFELNKVKQGQAFFDRTYSKPGEITFIRQFTPYTDTSHDFEWTFPKQDNQWVYFNVDFYMPKDKLPRTYTGTWSKICGG